jgi:hypothetical protein
MKRFLVFAFTIISFSTFAQDIAVQIKEAENLERQFKEDLAYEKYRSLGVSNPNEIKFQVKAALLAMSNAARQKDKNQKKMYTEMAKTHAEKALGLNANSADANYAMAVVSGGMTEVVEENKKKIEYVKLIKTYADKALSIDPNHPRANHVLGKWHYEVSELGWIKKAAVKAIFGGMPEASIETAITLMEKCRTLDQYYMLNYFDLAKAYEAADKPEKELEVLNKLVKLPILTADDARLKEEGKKMLKEMQ